MARPVNSDVPPPLVVPDGSYKKTAENYRIEGDNLVAALHREDGDLQAASVNLREPRFANIDGVLVYEESYSSIASRLSNSAPATSQGSNTAATVGEVAKAAAAVGHSLSDDGPGEYTSGQGGVTVGSGDDIDTMGE